MFMSATRGDYAGAFEINIVRRENDVVESGAEYEDGREVV